MDAEELGCKLLLTPSGDPHRAPEKQTVGTVTASHKILTLQALSSSLNGGPAKRGCLSREKVFGSPPAVCPPKRPCPFARYRLRLWYFYLRLVFFTYGRGTVSKKDQTQFPDRGNRKQERPNRFSVVSKQDQPELQP